MLWFLFVAASLFLFPASSRAAARDPSAEDRDINKLINAAGKRDRAWEWRGPVAEVAIVARHGKPIAPKLLKLLDHPGDYSFDQHIIVDRQIQLVLCRIFDVVPDCARTVYCVRASEAQNRRVKAFWRARVEQFVREGK
jgi:hypothetical protein